MIFRPNIDQFLARIGQFWLFYSFFLHVLHSIKGINGLMGCRGLPVGNVNGIVNVLKSVSGSTIRSKTLGKKFSKYGNVYPQYLCYLSTYFNETLPSYYTSVNVHEGRVSLKLTQR